MVTIPYVKGTSESLQRIFNKYNVATTMHPLSKLRGMLVHLKNKISLEDSIGVVFQIPCKDCDEVHVGETGRKFGVRKAEHKQEAETLQKAHFTRLKKKEAETIITKSAISDHVAQENHTIEWKISKILSKYSIKFTRLYSTYIPILSDSKTADTPTTASQRQSDEACSKQ